MAATDSMASLWHLPELTGTDHMEMERQESTQQASSEQVAPLEEQVRQLMARVADLEKRVFELETEPPAESH